MTIPFPISDNTPINPPLGQVPQLPQQIVFMGDTANMSLVKAILPGMAYASQHSDCVNVTVSLDILRYGRILKASKLVGGYVAGFAFDGLYYVKSVKHNINHGEYKQSFTLSRNGHVSTTQNVLV